MITCKNIHKSYAGKHVLGGLDFEVRAEEFLTIFGPNGCGKSTLMNILAELEPVDSGSIVGLEALRGKLGFVFQDYRKSLLPWATVKKNICFPLALRGMSQKDQNRAFDEIQQAVNLPLDMQQSATTLSGGQAQLTAILRALIIKPKLLILDEPFAALDYERTLVLRDIVMRLALQMKLTVIVISHDLDEALLLGDRVLFLGRSPSTVKAVLDVPFSRPRKEELTLDPAYIALKKDALAKYRDVCSENPSILTAL